MGNRILSRTLMIISGFDFSVDNLSGFLQTSRHKLQTKTTGHPWLQVHDFLQGRKSWREIRQLNLSHLALRKGLNTFAYETTFRCSSTSRKTGTAKSRSRTVDLRSDRPAGVYETIRHGRDAFIYPHRGSRHSPGLPLISKTRGFVAPVTRLACEFSKVVNALLNSRLGTHFTSS